MNILMCADILWDILIDFEFESILNLSIKNTNKLYIYHSVHYL